MALRLGDLARDVITGFEGVIVAETQWLHGCRRLTLQPKALHEGKPIESQTFDEPQIEKVNPKVHQGTGNTGGPRPEPSRQKSPSR